MEIRKQNVSLRMNTADLRKIKLIASRLRARDSDVFRFAIKTALARMAPLAEMNARGSDLLPLFMEFGADLTKHFDLDTERLESIVNGDVIDPNKRVDHSDLELIALAGQEEHYAMIRLRELAQRPVSEAMGIASVLRDYLLEKYVGDGANQPRKVPTKRVTGTA